jgi:conjugal transfer pilus assembly protein TraF
MSKFNSTLKFSAIASSILLLSSSVVANQSADFYQKKPEGWYWYDDPKVVEKKPEKPKPKEEPKPKVIIMSEPKKEVQAQQSINKIEKTEEAPKALSTAWLRENYPKMQERALDNPTNPDGSPSKDVLAFMYVQKLVLDKAQNFSTAAHQAVQLDPLLDENNRVPLSTSSLMTFNSLLEKDREEALNYLTKKAGLWFFFDSTCRYCVHQLSMLDRLKSKYDFSIMNISVNNQPIKGMKQKWFPNKGQAKLLGLTMTPTVVLVVPPNNFYIVSQGLSSVEGLEKKILLAATVKNLLPKELKDRINPYAKGVVTSDQMKQLEKVQADIDKDPTKIVDYIQKTIGAN